MRSKFKIFASVILFLYAFSSCVTNRQTDLIQNINKNYPKVEPEEYQIIPGDQLAITVYSLDKKTAALFSEFNPRFTSLDRGEATYQWAGDLRNQQLSSKPISVYADGTIDFPYIGKIHVAGLTILEARNLISEKLDILYDGTSADVILFNRYFSVLGEMGANRILMNRDKINIFEALAISNGIGTFGDRSKVSILRQTKDGSEFKTFDLRSKDIIDSEYYYIQANDVLYVPQSKSRFLGGITSFTGFVSWITTLAVIVTLTIRTF